MQYYVMSLYFEFLYPRSSTSSASLTSSTSSSTSSTSSVIINIHHHFIQKLEKVTQLTVSRGNQQQTN
jgi:hypothetical protein